MPQVIQFDLPQECTEHRAQIVDRLASANRMVEGASASLANATAMRDAIQAHLDEFDKSWPVLP